MVVMVYQSSQDKKPKRKRRLGIGIRTKIILPYFLLILLIGGVGTYVLTHLVTSTLQDRINNQLIDAGRIVSEGVVQYEDQRLETLRTVAGTIGVAEAVLANDADALSELVPQILINDNMDAVEIVNLDGVAVYGWQQPEEIQAEPVERFGTDWSQVEIVQDVLNGRSDTSSDKFVFLSPTDYGTLIYTVGPIKLNGEQVGAVMIGSDLRQMTLQLSLNAVARVTFYNRQGDVLETALGGGQSEFISDVVESEANMVQIVAQLESLDVAVENPETETPLRQLNVLGQDYQLAFGDWRLRNQSFGIFSVAVPRNFLVSTLVNSRNLFVIIFSLGMMGVFVGGFLIAQRITRPIQQLVATATAVTEGNLEQRSGIVGGDEIGTLAEAFDTMTETLAQRNRQLLEKASELQAIVDSIADGVIVLDTGNDIVDMNPAARRLLSDMSHDFIHGSMRELGELFGGSGREMAQLPVPLSLTSQKPRRYQVGNRVLGAVAAPVKTPSGEMLGSVVVLRDVTRDVEAENLKDKFVETISHELRSPLTVIKASAGLLKNPSNGHLDTQFATLMQTLNRGAEELEHHINELISISEIQAGTLRLDRLEINLVDLVHQVAAKWQETAVEKSRKLEIVDEIGNLPICGDVARLTWAINNLLENAINYTFEDGLIRLRLYEKHEAACLDVIDNGTGIAVADQPYLFDRFFRAHSQRNFASRGVGLGLYLTRSIVELHNGRVSVSSEVGAGSTFTIALPLVLEKTHEPV